MLPEFKPFISVGIDVGSDFSEMVMVLPTQQFLDKKTFKIHHNRSESRETAVEKIKKAEETNSMKARIFMESTGIYHYPLFYYLKEAGLDVYIINPLITNSNKNFNIRKVKNDKFDAKKIALMGLNPELKVSNLPEDFILNLRNLTREYYNLMDIKSSYTIKLNAQLRIVFPQFRGIFSDLTGKASLMILKNYTSPENILKADSSKLIGEIATVSRRKRATAEEKYNKIIKAAQEAQSFGHGVESNFILIKKFIRLIELYDQEIKEILHQMNEIVKADEDKLFIKQVRLLESIKGVGFLSALTLMCEIGDFSVFKKPKQLVGYFGVDSSVNQSGHFYGDRQKMSKRGSRLARRVLYTATVHSIAVSSKGVPNNAVLRDYYLKKCDSGKPKMVAMGAIMRKLCNIIFAILRDNQPYVIKTPSQHCLEYGELHLQLVKSPYIAA